MDVDAAVVADGDEPDDAPAGGPAYCAAASSSCRFHPAAHPHPPSARASAGAARHPRLARAEPGT